MRDGDGSQGWASLIMCLLVNQNTLFMAFLKPSSPKSISSLKHAVFHAKRSPYSRTLADLRRAFEAEGRRIHHRWSLPHIHHRGRCGGRPCV